MKYRYFVTTEIEKEITKRNLPQVIVDKLESNSISTQPLGNDSNTGHVKIKLQRIDTHGGPRLVFFEEIRDDVTLYVLREIYAEHNKYIQKFNNVKKSFWIVQNDYSEEELREIDRKFESLKEKTVKENLPEEFRKYEERPRRFEASNDRIIYELPEWVNGYADVDDLYKKSIYDALVSIIVIGKYDANKFDKNTFYITEVEGYKMVLRLDVTDSGKMDGVYLIQISDSVNVDELIEHKYNSPDIKTLRRKSAKCYPDFLLLDWKSWKAIEDDSQANLALSDEELEILQNIEYPFFVSGLAGSGKSTILYYLYAHIYDYESKNHPEHPLLFLSYSKKLVANAQSIVKSILCHHPAYNLVEIFDDREKSRKFDMSFQPFQEFIKGEFLSMNELDDYASDKYIDYQKFKQLYQTCKLPESRNYSSDIVWSVIRTFIKGKDSSSIFTPLDYESSDLPAKDRTVTKEDYRQIYKIWENWYRKYFDEKTGWDDLDLVRYALSKYDDVTRFHKYAVIFCDEAQDFTKIETDLILKLSVHSKYNLSTREEDAEIPIAFAGDPNQTINPTGFRWGSTQEIFNDSFKECLATFAGFKPHELRTNYRSREGIVKFANTIQSIRHHLLSDGRQHFTLQEAWDSEQSAGNADGESLNYVAFYSIDENRDKILKGMKKAIIITADEGEYNMDTIQSDPDLKDVDSSKLYTAITAKGLEFKATILYKFGSDPAVSLFERLMNGEPFDDDSARYQLSHFFTKLYIAISRAKQVLFVVDTNKGYEKLWKYFVDRDMWNNFLKRYMPKSANDLGRMSMGDISDFEHRLAENYKPREYAESLFKAALEGEDPDTMNRARSAYKEAKCEDKAALCKAYILKFKGDFENAGTKFLDLGQYDLALNSYWDGGIWDQVLLILQTDSKQEEGRAFKKAIATFMDGKSLSLLSDFLKNSKENEDEFQDSLSNPRDRDLWKRIIWKICDIAGKLKPKDVTATLLRDLDRFSDYIEWYECGIAGIRAELHFKRAEFENRDIDTDDPEFKDANYNAAIRCWDSLPEKVTTKEYFTAKKIVSKTPSEKIIWMEKLGEVADILSIYGNVETAASLTEDAQNRIFNLLLAKDMTKALEYPYPKDRGVKWNTLYFKDRVNFLRTIILKDFNEEKFEFLKGKVETDDYNAFQTVLPDDIFDSIFSLKQTDINETPYWTYFVSKLKNRIKERVFTNAVNRDTILESLGKIIKASTEINKPLATCFLEMLFDGQYNSGRARKYLDVLTHMFGQDVFFKEDFRAATKRNDYFTAYCPLKEEDIDCIKVNLHQFAHEYLSGITKKITATQARDTAQPLFMAFEISVPYQDKQPDYTNICSEYKTCLNDEELKKRYDLLTGWMERRYIFNKLLDDCQHKKSTYAQIRNEFKFKNYDLNQFVMALSREDAIAYVIATNRNGDEYSYDSILLTAETIYRRHLRRVDFSSYCTVNQLRDTLADSVDQAVMEILSDKNHVKEYEIKLLTLIWEQLGDHAFAAARYNDLIDRERLDKVTRIKNYFKRRALLHYAYLKKNEFEEKQAEYNITMTKDYLPSAYPKIERVEKADAQSSAEKPAEKKPAEKAGQAAAAAKKTEKNGLAVAPAEEKRKTAKSPARKAAVQDPVKQAMIKMARKMKESGMDIEQIMKFTNLSKTEVRKA